MSDHKKKHPEFQKLIDTMAQSGYDYKQDLEYALEKYNKRSSGKPFSFADHIKALVFAQLSSHRRWSSNGHSLYDHEKEINQIFCNYDADQLLAKTYNELMDMENRITEIQCGNLRIKAQIMHLQDNIRTLQKIEKEHGLDKYVLGHSLNGIIDDFCGGQYNLFLVGPSLAAKYLRNVGCDCINPNVHVRRILFRLGYSSDDPVSEEDAIKKCNEIAKEYNKSRIEVDSILWQYCANDRFQECTNCPSCTRCQLYPCVNHPSKTK